MIPTRTYKKIIELLPILCVDVVIANEQGEYLLVKRGNEPLKGAWWVPGGRVLKGEQLEHAAKRKVKEELGIRIKVERPVGYYEDKYRENSFDLNTELHTIGMVFLARPLTLNVKLDGQSLSWGFFKKLPKRFKVKPFMGAEPFTL